MKNSFKQSFRQMIVKVLLPIFCKIIAHYVIKAIDIFFN